MTNVGKLFDLNLKVGDVVVVDKGICVTEGFVVVDVVTSDITMIGTHYGRGNWASYSWPDNIWRVVSRALDSKEPEVPKPMHPDEAVRCIDEFLRDAGMEMKNITIETQDGGYYNA